MLNETRSKMCIRIAALRKNFTTTPNLQTHNYSQNYPLNSSQTPPKLLPNYSQTTPKLLPNFSQTTSKLLSNSSQTTSKLLSNYSLTTPKLLKNTPKLFLNCSQNYPSNSSQTALKLL